MAHQLYASLDEMLAPASLSAIEGRAVTGVRQEAFGSVDGLSGARFLRITTEPEPYHRYVLKRIAWGWDWIMRLTDDVQCRAVVTWQEGLLDRLPAEIVHGVRATAADGVGWAMLIDDFGDAMIPPGDEWISPDDNRVLLDGMAATDATFWGQTALADPARGYMPLLARYLELSPGRARTELESGEPVPPMVIKGWELLPTLVEPDVFGPMARLIEDPAPLAMALARYPQTVIHGDWKLGNLGILREASSHAPTTRIVLLDWATIGPAPPAVDLAWYLAVNSARLPVSKEETIGLFEAALWRRLGAAFDPAWWEPSLKLALLGGFLQLCWPKALGAALGDTEAVRARELAELAWWSARVREALPLL
ncbi:MAG: hypothetical protein QOF51_2837 [Chloroflexota bacterium]|jgi:hypothetical protein|nr:hypothetical protein [Chloroflexota bacterium]